MKKISLKVLSLLLVGVSTLVASQVLANSASIDTSFKTGTPVSFDSSAYSVGVQSNGKIVAGGRFTTYKGVPANHIASINADGTKDPNFDAGTGFNSAPFAIGIQSNDKIIVGGNFTDYKGTSVNRIVRLNTNGSIDTAFDIGNGFDNDVNAILVQSNGKIVIGGSFTTYKGVAANRLIRLNTDGSRDTGFNMGVGVGGNVYTLALQSDGKLIAGGEFYSYNQITSRNLVRINTNGSIDTGFDIGNGFNQRVNAITIQSDGKVLVGGQFRTYKGAGYDTLIRLNSDGSKDESFDAPGSDVVYSLGIQSDNKVIVGGYESYRLNTDGSKDESFDAGIIDVVYAIKILSNGKMIFGGSLLSTKGDVAKIITRLNNDGSKDTTFNVGNGFNARISNITKQSDGKFLIGGNFSSYQGVNANKLIRLNSDGSVDTGFNIGLGFNNFVAGTSVGNNGKIAVIGFFTSYNGTPITKIALLNSDGSIDTSFNPGSSFVLQPLTVAIQSDGKLIVAGNFISYNGTSVKKIVRLNTDGSIDTSFLSTGTDGDSINAVTIQDDGKIIVAGKFWDFNGGRSPHIVRLNTDGTTDTSFFVGSGYEGLSVPYEVWDLAQQSDGKIVVCGWTLTRLNTNGSIDTGFNASGFSYAAYSLDIQDDGKIVVGGEFSSYYQPDYQGPHAHNIARLNSDGSRDETFNEGLGFNAPVNAVAIQSGGKILIGGQFGSYDGFPVSFLTSLYGDSNVVNLPNSTDTGTITSAFITQGYIQTSGSLVGSTPISLSGTDGNIPTTLDITNQNLNLNIPGDTQIKQGDNTTNYSGVLSVPIINNISSVNNQQVIIAFNVGSTSSSITLAGGYATLLIPVPGQMVGTWVQVYYSSDNGVTWYPEIITQIIDYIGQPYVQFTTNHFGDFAITPLSDSTPPVISLIGDATIHITQGTTYTDAGATASDNIDGNITANIVTSGSVDTSTAGTYSISYNVSDVAGNIASEVTRSITVSAKGAPTATIEYNITGTTDQDVIATVTGFSESITGLNTNTHTFTANGTFVFTFQDIYGNSGSITANVTWINKNTGGSAGAGGSSSSSSNLATSILNESLHGAALHEIGSIQNSPYSDELNNAYLWAFGYDITTMNTIQKANMESVLLRKDMAKMISNFAVNVLKKTPSTGTNCTFSDTKGLNEEAKAYITLSCKLGLIGYQADGVTIKKNFDPLVEVDRGQFGTILSRLLRGAKYNGGTPYFSKHLKALKEAGIMTKIATPLQKEIRGYVMLMMMRASK